MASAAVPTVRRIPPPRIYGKTKKLKEFSPRFDVFSSANLPRRRSTNEVRPSTVYETDHDHDKC